jgi:hypothetical protein
VPRRRAGWLEVRDSAKRLAERVGARRISNAVKQPRLLFILDFDTMILPEDVIPSDTKD